VLVRGECLRPVSRKCQAPPARCRLSTTNTNALPAQVPDGADTLLTVIRDRLKPPELHGGSKQRRASGGGGCGAGSGGTPPPADDGLSEAFEFRALEAVLLTICYVINHDLSDVESAVLSALATLKRSTSSVSLDKLRRAQNQTDEYAANVRGVHDALQTKVLANDEDMARMYLTYLQRHPRAWYVDAQLMEHEQVELMLEHYLQIVDSAAAANQLLVQRIQNSQGMIAAELDTSRNRLIKVNLYISTVAMSVSLGSAVAGVFGMNLHNGLELDEDGFGTVSACIGASTAAVALLSLGYYWWSGILRTI
jgi:hypothetical protein